MKPSKRDLRTRVKPFLPIEFTDEPLTSHAGLELFRRFAEQAGWIDRLRAVFADRGFDSDYGSFRTVLVVVGMLLLGGSRLSHLRVLDRDPLFRRLVRLRRLPDERTLSRGLQAITGPYRDELNAMLRDVAYEVLTASRVEYAVKVPMWKWLGVRQRIAARRSWTRVNASHRRLGHQPRADSRDRDCTRGLSRFGTTVQGRESMPDRG